MIKYFSAIILAFFTPVPVHGQSENCQDFSIAGTNLQMPVMINGNEYPAQLTTSNIASSITQSLVDELGLTERSNPNIRIVSTFGRDNPYKYVRDIELTLFGNTIETEEMAIVDGNTSAAALSLRLFDGLITQINFPESKMCFYSRNTIDLQNFQNADLDSDPRYGTPVEKTNRTPTPIPENWRPFSVTMAIILERLDCECPIVVITSATSNA